MKLLFINTFNKKMLWIIMLMIIIVINIVLFLCIRQIVWITLSVVLSTILINFISKKIIQPEINNEVPPRISNQTRISLGVISLIGSFVIYAFRRLLLITTINPYTDWNTSGIHQVWYSEGTLEATVAVYNKFHIRQGFFQTLIFFFLFYFLFYYAIRFVNNLYPKKITLHPANSIFVLLSLIYAVRFPPYDFDLAHWGGWVGTAVGISNGNWPFIHTPNQYGVIPSVILNVITQVSSMTQFWLYALTASTVTLAGFASYILISKISKSKWIGLFGTAILLFGFHIFSSAILYPNSGAWRYQFMLSTTLLLCWYLLFGKENKWSLIIGVILGLFLWWDPVFQAFMAIALTASFLYLYIVEKDLEPIKKLISIIIGGLIPLVVVLIFSEGKPPNIFDFVQRTLSPSKVFSQGYGGLPQYITWPNILWAAGGFFGIIKISDKLFNQKRLTKEDLFITCGFVYLFPLLMYNINRTSWIGDYAIAWIMLPLTILIVRMFVEKTDYHRYYYPITGIIFFSLLISQQIIENFTEQTNNLLFGYEGQRYGWAINCREKIRTNNACWLEWPDPFVEFKRTAKKPLINLDDPTNLELITYCQNNVPIISTMDAYIYLYGRCNSQFEVSGLGNAVDIPTIDGMIELIIYSDKVVVDNRNRSALGGLIDNMSQALIDNGFYISHSLSDGLVNVYKKE